VYDFGTKPRFSFEILILQASWFTVNLHDFGAKSTLVFPKGEQLAKLVGIFIILSVLVFGTKFNFENLTFPDPPNYLV